MGLALLLGLAVVPTASGFVPEPDRVTRAVADLNKTSGRGQAFRLDLSMRIDGGDVVAVGELVTHPTGLARLELRGAGGLVERHVLQGSQHQASRNGALLEQYRAFLPPLFLLQADSKLTLDAALAAVGVRADLIGLAPCGERNCFVLGDPSRVVRPRAAAAPADSEPAGATATGRAVPGSFATIWVDIESYEVRRIESPGGVTTTLGPPRASEGLVTPSWIRIEEEGQASVQFEVTGATLVNAPAAVFSERWLLAPVEPAGPPPPAETPGNGPAAVVDPQSF